MLTRDIGRATVRRQRKGHPPAAVRRTRQRRHRRAWMCAGVAIAAAVTAAGLTLLRHGGGAPAVGSGPPGPEGVPMQTGAPLAPTSGAPGGAPVDGIRCDAAEHVAYHIHAHLAVFVDGVPRSIPYGIGVVQPTVFATPDGPFAAATRCYYWLHTHTADGVVHVESPTRRQYTLGDFFDIWGQPLGSTRIGPASGTVTGYVNGTRYSGDPRAIVLSEHEDIQLDVGMPVVSPQPVDWSVSRL